MRRPDVFTLDHSHPLAQGLHWFPAMRGGDAARIYNAALSRGYAERYEASGGSVSVVEWQNFGRFGAYATNGASGYYATEPAYTISLPVTLSFWQYLGTQYTITGGSCPLLRMGTYNNFAAGLAHVYGTPYKVKVKFKIAYAAAFDFDLMDSSAWTPRFAHCAVVVRQNSQDLYVDGQLVTSATVSLSASYSNVSFALATDGATGSTGIYVDPMVHLREVSPAEIALLADRTDSMLGGLIVEERPVLYFDMGGSTVDALTASNLTVSAPVLGTPALGQAHALTASGITVEGPVLGAPALAQIHALTAQNFTVSSPVLGAPTLAQTHTLTATGLTVTSPAIGTPTLGQVHALTASNLAISSPVLGTPALTENAPTVDNLTADTLVVGSPALGTPAIGQVHSLTAQNFATSSPVLGTPALTENAADVDALTADSLVVGSPVLGTPAIGQVHVLGSDGLVTGSPVLGSPSITQIHVLEALGLTVGVPVLGTPAFNGSDIVLITADEVARVVSSQSRMKIVMAASRQKQVIYAVS